jgi:hypothetical protein
MRGPENVLADAFSCVPRAESMVRMNISTNDDVIDEHYLECFHSVLNEPELFECFLNLPETNAPAENPLNMKWIREQQQNDPELLASAMKYPERYVNKNVDDTKILCHVKPGDDPETQWKIALAQGMALPTINWFHQILGHPGTRKMRLTLQTRYFHRDLRRLVDQFNCEACQKQKLDGRGFGLFPKEPLLNNLGRMLPLI